MNKKDYMTILSREMGLYTYKDVQEIVEELSAHLILESIMARQRGKFAKNLAIL